MDKEEFTCIISDPRTKEKFLRTPEHLLVPKRDQSDSDIFLPSEILLGRWRSSRIDHEEQHRKSRMLEQQS
jgi:hypothetical protein